MPYALVTGASKGIGKCIAVQLAQRGWDLLLVARSEDLLSALSDQLSMDYKIRVHFLATDLTRDEAASIVYSWVDGLRINPSMLVNNAGYGLSGSTERYTASEYKKMLRINIITPVELCNLFMAKLRAQERAYIMNIASTAAYQAIPLLNVYAASKTFILQYSRALHLELKNTKVSVTCVSPGTTHTNFAQVAQVSDKAMKLANKVGMSPESVARVAVEATLNGKTEVVVGLMNKLGAFLAWLFPKKIVEMAAGKIYE